MPLSCVPHNMYKPTESADNCNDELEHPGQRKEHKHHGVHPVGHVFQGRSRVTLNMYMRWPSLWALTVVPVAL